MDNAVIGAVGVVMASSFVLLIFFIGLVATVRWAKKVYHTERGNYITPEVGSIIQQENAALKQQNLKIMENLKKLQANK